MRTLFTCIAATIFTSFLGFNPFATAAQALTKAECHKLDLQAHSLNEAPKCEEMEYGFCESEKREEYKTLLKQMLACPADSLSVTSRQTLKIYRKTLKSKSL